MTDDELDAKILDILGDAMTGLLYWQISTRLFGCTHDAETRYRGTLKSTLKSLMKRECVRRENGRYFVAKWK